jgi:type I restriction enzyme S subunit
VKKIEKQKGIIEGAERIEENYLTELYLANYNSVVLDDYIQLTRGHNPTSDVFIDEPKEGYTRFIQIRDFVDDSHLTFVPTTKNLKLVKRGEILMAAYRHIGKVSRNVEGAFNVALIKFESRDEKTLLNDFLYYLIPSGYIRDQLLKVSERSHIPSTSVEVIKDLKIPLPPLETQCQIVEKLDRQMQALGSVRLLKSEAQKRIEEILSDVWGEK